MEKYSGNWKPRNTTGHTVSLAAPRRDFPQSNISAPSAGGFPSEAVIVLLHMLQPCSARLHPTQAPSLLQWKKVITQTSFKRFIRREESRREDASARVEKRQQQTEQGLYRVTWGSVFPGRFSRWELVRFQSLQLGLARSLLRDWLVFRSRIGSFSCTEICWFSA